MPVAADSSVTGGHVCPATCQLPGRADKITTLVSVLLSRFPRHLYHRFFVGCVPEARLLNSRCFFRPYAFSRWGTLC